MKTQICHVPTAEEASKYLLSKKNDLPNIVKYGFLVQPAQIAALRMHCITGAPLWISYKALRAVSFLPFCFSLTSHREMPFGDCALLQNRTLCKSNLVGFRHNGVDCNLLCWPTRQS